MRSIVYSSLFEYPLTAGELSYSLQDFRLPEQEIRQVYQGSQWLQKRVALHEDAFFLRGREKSLSTRRTREALARSTLTRNRAVLSYIARLPNLRLLALSGSAAHLTMSERADIDLFIVTRGERVWSTAVAILLMSRFLGCRKLLCFNYLIADSRLTFEERDLFTANQIIHLTPLRGLECLEALREANPWVDEIYPGSRPPREAPTWLSIDSTRDGLFSGWLERVLQGAFGKLLETVCRVLYRRYLLWRSPGWTTPDQVRLEYALLKLHTSSHAGEVLTLYTNETARQFERTGVSQGPDSSA